MERRERVVRMLSHHLRVFAICLVVALALASWAAAPAFAFCNGNHNPSTGPGPGPCWGSSSGGSAAGGSGCATCMSYGVGGKPVAEINTYTGNLTIQDTPVYYKSVGQAVPFTIAFNSQSTRTGGVLGTGWTHTYAAFVANPGGTSGITIVDGSGWEHFFALSGTTYISPQGIFRKLAKNTSTSEFELTCLDGHVMYFGTTSGALKRIADSDGLTWTLTNPGATPSAITDPKGRVTSLTYTSGKLTRVTVPGGLHADFTYDANGRLSTVTDALSDSSTGQYTFGFSGTDTKVVRIVDPSGREVDYTYTTFANAQSGLTFTVVDTVQTYGLPASMVSYDWYANPNDSTQLYVDVTEYTNYATSTTRVTRHVYDNSEATGHYFGTLLSVVKDVGGVAATQAWAYNSNLKRVRYRDSYAAETGGKAHRHFYDYLDPDNASKVTKYIDPENSDASPTETGTPTTSCPGTLYEYDNNGTGDQAHLGRVTKVTTPEGRVTDYTYVSGTRRLSSVIVRDRDVNNNAVDRTTSYTYYGSTNAYQLYTTTDGRGNVTTYAYDSTTGYLTTETPATGGATTYGSNNYGDVTSVTDGNGNTTSYQYDGIHRLTQTTYPNVGAGQKTSTTSWGCCGKIQDTDENGVVTKYYYEDDKSTPVRTHRVWKVVQDYGTGKLNYTTEYSYTDVGNRKTVVNARSKTTTYTYDGADRTTRVDYPDSTYETWTYRDDGRVYTHTDARSRTTYYRYDADDRPAGPYSGGYVAINYPNDTDVYITRDKDGMITETRDASGTTTKTYYPSERVKTVTVSAGSSKTLTYDYNNVGLVSSLTIPDGRSFSYTYSARNLLSTLTNPNSTQWSFTYDNGGRLTRITRPGSYINYGYNARNWITNVQNRKTDSSTLFDMTYAYQDGTLYDSVGNPLVRTEVVDGTTYTTTYRYDAVNRQVSESRTPGAYSLSYGYDAVGNRTTRTLDGTTYTNVYDDNNKLTSASGGGLTASFGYDSSGNMTSVSGTMYTAKTMVYNDANRLTSITYGGVTDTYAYNWEGLRTRALLSGTYQRYFYDGERVLEDLNDSGGTLARYTITGDSYGDTLLGFQRNDGGVRYPVLDLIGTARRLVDGSATVTDAYSLDAFGRNMFTSGSTPNPYRYGAAWGYITDPSGLLQLGARYYWPEVGRFVSQDPSGDGSDWYTYAGNSPVTAVDPEGLRETSPGCRAAIHEGEKALKELEDRLADAWRHGRGMGPFTCGYFDGKDEERIRSGHEKAFENARRWLARALRRIDQACTKADKAEHAGRIGRLREGTNMPNPYSNAAPFFPFFPLPGPIPMPAPAPCPLKLPFGFCPAAA